MSTLVGPTNHCLLERERDKWNKNRGIFTHFSPPTKRVKSEWRRLRERESFCFWHSTDSGKTAYPIKSSSSSNPNQDRKWKNQIRRRFSQIQLQSNEQRIVIISISISISLSFDLLHFLMHHLFLQRLSFQAPFDRRFFRRKILPSSQICGKLIFTTTRVVLGFLDCDSLLIVKSFAGWFVHGQLHQHNRCRFRNFFFSLNPLETHQSF